MAVLPFMKEATKRAVCAGRERGTIAEKRGLSRRAVMPEMLTFADE